MEVTHANTRGPACLVTVLQTICHRWTLSTYSILYTFFVLLLFFTSLTYSTSRCANKTKTKTKRMNEEKKSRMCNAWFIAIFHRLWQPLKSLMTLSTRTTSHLNFLLRSSSSSTVIVFDVHGCCHRLELSSHHLPIYSSHHLLKSRFVVKVKVDASSAIRKAALLVPCNAGCEWGALSPYLFLPHSLPPPFFSLSVSLCLPASCDVQLFWMPYNFSLLLPVRPKSLPTKRRLHRPYVVRG